MPLLLSLRWFKALITLAAFLSCLLILQTARSFVDFALSTRKIEISITELCPINEDSYALDVVIRNNSKHSITVESYGFQVQHEGRLVASVAEPQPVSIGSLEEYKEQLVLTTNLPPEKRPDKLNSCGFAAGWAANGHVYIVLPFAREKVRLTVSAGAD